jgi:hypothetical protein
MNFLDRIGQLNIPNGLAGPPGAAGINGAGWTSGSGDPVSAPPADIKYYLNTTTGQIFEYNSPNWDSVVATINGTNGNVWFTGSGAPTSVPGAVANDFYLDTVAGNIYQFNGVTWGSPISTIKGTNGTNGVNGTGLLGSVVTTGIQSYSASPSYQSIDTFLASFNITVNAFDAFPTIGSVVKSTMYIKARYSKSGSGTVIITPPAGENEEISYVPKILDTNGTPYSLDPTTLDQSTLINSRILWQPSVVATSPTHGEIAQTGQEFAWARINLPRTANSSVSGGRFPAVYTKITTTLIRVGTAALNAMVEYTSTSRYGTYTAVYDPETAINQNFTPSDSIAIGFGGNIKVPVDTITLSKMYHIVEKSIL